MAKFKVVTTELTTYVHYVEAETEDQAIDKVTGCGFNDGYGYEGEEIAHDFQIEKVEEV